MFSQDSLGPDFYPFFLSLLTSVSDNNTESLKKCDTMYLHPVCTATYIAKIFLIAIFTLDNYVKH